MSNYNFESGFTVSSSKFNSAREIQSEDEAIKNKKIFFLKEKIFNYVPLIYFFCVIVGLIYIFFF